MGIFFRVLFTILVPALIVVGLLSYLMYLQGRNPVDMLTAPFRGKGAATVSRAEPVGTTARGGRPAVASAPSRVYRWTDPEGNLHFSDRPPEYAARVESLRIDPNANLIQGLPGGRPRIPATAPAGGPGSDATGNPYAPAAIRDLFRKAEQARETLNDRYRKQEAILQQRH